MSGGGLSRWPPLTEIPEVTPAPLGVKNSVDDGEHIHIQDGYQYICFGEFIFNGGDVTIDGDLVVIGDLSDDELIDSLMFNYPHNSMYAGIIT